MTKLNRGEVISLGDKTHLVASSAVPLAMGSEQDPAWFIYRSNAAKDAGILGLCTGTGLQERSVISSTSLSLAVPVGWTETFPCETLQAAVMLRCQWSSLRHVHLALFHLLIGLCLQ